MPSELSKKIQPPSITFLKNFRFDLIIPIYQIFVRIPTYFSIYFKKIQIFINKGKPLAWRDAKSFSFVFLFEFFVGDCPIRKTLLN